MSDRPVQLDDPPGAGRRVKPVDVLGDDGFESSGGLELAEKCLKKGMSDANPKVREGMRATYWVFASVWPDKGEA